MSLQLQKFQNMTKEIQSEFLTSLKDIAPNPGMQFFGITPTSLLDHKHQLDGGMGGLEIVAEGQDYPRGDGEEDNSITYTQKLFARSYAVTKLLRMFWRKENGSPIKNKIQTVPKAYNAQVSHIMADMLSHGNETTAQLDALRQKTLYLCPDGLPLFHAQHTSKLDSTYRFSNIITAGDITNPEFSREAVVEMMVRGANNMAPITGSGSEEGALSMPIDYDTILVAPALYDEVVRELQSDKIAGSANNDTNESLAGLKIVKWSALTKTFNGVDKSACWYMIDSTLVKESLKMLIAQPLQIAPKENNPSNGDWIYNLDAVNTLGLGAPYGIAKSEGTNVA